MRYLIIVILLISINSSAQTYCSATNTFENERIERVRLLEIDNSSTWASYSDYTNFVATVLTETWYPFTVNCNYGWPLSALGIWIDWNQDGDFVDVGEYVFYQLGAPDYTGQIISTAAALSGQTRMRIRMTYDVVQSSCGEFVSGEVEDYSIRVIRPPDTDFSASETTIITGDYVDFTDLSANTPTSWQWWFESGTPSTSAMQNPANIQYLSSGNYNVTLTSDNLAGNHTEIKTNYITVNNPPAPTAQFSSNRVDQTEGGYISFVDQSTQNPTSWAWTFVGGTPGTSTLENPVIQYNTAGLYDVTLQATNSTGSDTEVKLNYITITEAIEKIMQYSNKVLGTSNKIYKK